MGFKSKLFYLTAIILMSKIKGTMQQCPGFLFDPADYIGCFMDQLPRTMPHYFGSYDVTLDNNKCISYCKDLKFSYAGTESHRQCFCGNYQNWTIAPNAECNTNCLGDVTQICGGVWRLSVYQTGFNIPNKVYSLIGDRRLNSTSFNTVNLANKGSDVECAVYCKRAQCSVFSIYGAVCEMYKYEDLCSGYVDSSVARVYMLK